MALKAGYKGIKKIGTGLKLTTEGSLSLDGSGPGGSVNLDDLGDVAITDPADGQILQYDAASHKWVNHVNNPEYISISVDIYSAASDTVTYTDETGQKTVTTDTDGHGQTTITCANGDSITFTSSVAKNPDSLSNAYSKTVTIGVNTTEVYVMPDNTAYWYGCITDKGEDVLATNGWEFTNFTLEVAVRQTNCLYMNPTIGYEQNKFIGFAFKNQVSGATANVIYEAVTSPTGGFTGRFLSTKSKTISDGTLNVGNNLSSTSIAKDTMSISAYGNQNISVGSLNNRQLKVYALWVE